MRPFTAVWLLALLAAVCTSSARATGWAVGGSGLVIRSADAGQSWTSSSPATQTLNAVHFVSDDVGWGVGSGGIAIKTINGGDTWTQTSPGSLNLNGVFFTDANHGWIVGDGGKVLRTTNGGSSWTTSTPTTAALYGVYFLDESLGWAVGNGVVLRTTNGGALWSHASPTTLTLRDVYFASAVLGCAVGNNGVVLKSTNGGLSWTSSTRTSSDLYSVHFASTTLGWAVGEAGAILKTTDGGANWSTQRPSTAILRSVYFIDDMNGWAVGSSGTVVQTSDGGDRWDVSHPAAVTLTGVFFASIPTGVPVTVDTDPPGLTVTVDGIDYTAAHTFRWDPGSLHTLATSSPQSGAPGTRHLWSSWSNGGAIIQTVSPQTATTYTARFTAQHFLTMTTVASGSVTPASGWFDAGSTVSISATPDPGYGFNGWTGSGTGAYSGWSNPVSIDVDGPIIEAASFSGNVTVIVKSTPTGASFVVDGTTYTTQQTFTWTAGSSHTLDAPSPQLSGSGTRRVFSRWSDLGGASHIVAPVSNTTYTVTYQTQYLLTMQAGTGGSVTPGTGWRDAGTSVSISASPDSGYYFGSWSGMGSSSYTGSSNPRSISMNGPITEQALFVAGTMPEFPAELTLLQNAPNPASTETDLRFGLPADADVMIEMFDVSGRRVFENVARAVPRGWQTYRLDLSAGGIPAGSGVYFVRISTAGTSRAGRLVILR